MKIHFEHMDAAESAFFARQLEALRARTYDIKYANLKAREFIPVDNSVSPGAETLVYRAFDRVGLARIITHYADDLPRADVLGKEFVSKIRSLGVSYGYSVQEARAAQYAGMPLDARKAAAARRAAEELIEKIAETGDAANGLLGFLNQSNTNTYVPPNGASGSPLWVNKTPDEIVADMHGIANGIVVATKEVEVPDTLLLPLASFALVSTKRMGDGSNETILSFFLKTSPFIKTVAPWFVLDTAGAGATKRMVCYRKDPDVLQLVIPQEFEQFPPQQRGLEVVTACHARIGGVVVYYPLAMSYGDGI